MTAWFIICFYLPLLVETILILRLIAVFPPRLNRRHKLYLILVFPILVKIVRVVSVILLTILWVRLLHQSISPLEAGHRLLSKSPFVKMALVSQLLDNT